MIRDIARDGDRLFGQFGHLVGSVSLVISFVPSRIGAITRSLNERKIPTPRGSQWHVSSVANLLARVQKLEAVL